MLSFQVIGDLSVTDQLSRVLVVDDDEGSRAVFCKLLTSAGYVVQSAYDGLDAIRHMEKTQFNVVLADVCMPPCLRKHPLPPRATDPPG
jgi:CheY-like chemotaxis protein